MLSFDPIKLAIFEFLSARGVNTDGRCNLQQWRKNDGSVVTDLDIFISATIKDFFKNQPAFSQYNYYSEEDFATLQFPAIIIDPIDGTEGLVRGTGESVVSLAIMDSDKIHNGHGIIYNPFSGLELNTFKKNDYTFAVKMALPSLLGLVSRHEWQQGVFLPYISHQKFKLVEKGSIANKLAFLTMGMCDFILSYRPKRIWDIAAGTILAQRMGYNLYSRGERITKLNMEVLPGPLLWCREADFPDLWAFFGQ